MACLPDGTGAMVSEGGLFVGDSGGSVPPDDSSGGLVIEPAPEEAGELDELPPVVDPQAADSNTKAAVTRPNRMALFALIVNPSD